MNHNDTAQGLVQPPHLPASAEEAAALGWSEGLDVVIVTGDAHVDHPSFPAALLGRVLVHHGFRVGVISRPRVDRLDDFMALGMPRLFFGVTAGALDSMVANYTALKKPRRDDPYGIDGKAGGRPDRAVTGYCNLLRRAFGKKVLLVAGGIEASLRKFSHYDYWSDSIRRPLLMDCGADLLVHGMGEGPVVELAQRISALEEPVDYRSLHQQLRVDELPGVIFRQPLSIPASDGWLALPSAEQAAANASEYARAYQVEQQWLHGGGDGSSSGDARPSPSPSATHLVQACAGQRVVANPPWPPLLSARLDQYYGLPFSRDVHPRYGAAPVSKDAAAAVAASSVRTASARARRGQPRGQVSVRVPALEQVRFSITTHRGCAGGCAFCAICSHQGRDIQSRSPRSVEGEAVAITRHPQFKGVINDVGGPSANMYAQGCRRPNRSDCRRTSCLWPRVCPDYCDDAGAARYRRLLSRLRSLPKVRHVFVTTGIRMDLALMGGTGEASLVSLIARHHTSGLLKVAPESFCAPVLKLMRKPGPESFHDFLHAFRHHSRQAGKEQYVIPYLIAAHPGCDLEHMVEVALTLRRERMVVEQCQIFTPTPGTASTVMYATGLNPETMRPVFVEKDPHRKNLQKALILHHLPENRALVREAMELCGRQDAALTLLPKPAGRRHPRPAGAGPREGLGRRGRRASN